MTGLYLGIDVGSTSARAGLFDRTGTLRGVGREGFETWTDGPRVEQSSSDIWRAVGGAVRAALAEAGAQPNDVRGVGFDAACSMVVLDREGRPVSVGDHPERDVIVWMDQRAVDQAHRINGGDHAVLRYVGGRISPEMQTPKLLWLREQRPQSYGRAAHFFDLADFLTFRATGNATRSLCTLTCKWTYLAHEDRFDPGYFQDIGLGDLAADGFARIGSHAVRPGTPIGGGLANDAAAHLGLVPGTPVAAGLIDAHAGGLGTVGAPGGSPTERMAYVFGTSACTMSSSAQPVFVPGVWGPYHSAMIPGLWLNEGGQSAAGAAIDRLIEGHPARDEAQALAGNASLTAWLADEAARRAPDDPSALAGELIVVPDFLGNRAPFADPSRRAVIAGLGMEMGVNALLALYVAGLCGIGYGLRQIIAAQGEQGLNVNEIVVSGGAGSDPTVRRILADSAAVAIATPETSEPVLLGAAILGTLACGDQPHAKNAAAAMSRIQSRLEPAPSIAARHERSFDRFCRLQAAAST